MVRKICVITATRAEYGLLRPLLRLLQADQDFELQLVVGGAHLCTEFGETWKEIEADGFEIAGKVEYLLASDRPVAVAKSAALALSGFASVFCRLAPELLVILGDRYEMAAAALAATLLRIPIAHIHGGETTLGANDEAFRHAITKMSHIHFASCEPYRRRVVQLGESPSRVFNVGALGLDAIRESRLIDATELAKTLGLKSSLPYVVVTYHPETLGSDDPAGIIDTLLDALLEVPELQLVCTKANADAGGRAINARLQAYALRSPERVKVFSALGTLKYLSAIKHSAGVIGNTSSGIIEAPALLVTTLDIGSRQSGRIRAKSVLHADANRESIRMGISQLLSPLEPRPMHDFLNPYGDGHTASRILTILAQTHWPLPIVKTFHDIAYDPN
jgi:GDP/UDP-N,N'-diacetylbacillosamine 2-epimerase (hydrolysing)